MHPLGFIVLLIISLQCGLVENSENVPQYLVRRLRETKVQIAKEFIQRDTVPDIINLPHLVISSSYDTQWTNLWSEELHSERTLMVRAFNKMCILEGNRVISVAIKPATNETNSALREVALIRQERPVKFVKSIFWKSKLYLLVCYEDDSACGLYTGNNEVQLKHKQIIKDKGWPMDATFFTRGNRLYLVVAHNTDQFPVSSVIYHWTGTYMDVIHQLLMVGVVSVTAFNYKNSTIMIFGQNEKRQPDIGSGIYKFDDNGINMIQYLLTNGPISIHYYTHDEQIFLVVINEIEASNVYWWDGDEFLHWVDLPEIVAPSMISVAHFSGDTLFFVSYESYVTVYKVSSSAYLRLNLLKLDNGERIVDMGVWTDERATLTVLLITVDPQNLYRVETWELRMKKKPEHASLKEAEGATERCLLDLEYRLNERVTPMENLKEAEGATERCLLDLESRLNKRVTPMEKLARKTWPMLLPSAKNINIGALNGTNRLEKLVLHSGSIAKLDVFSSGRILLASEIESLAGSSGAGGGSRTIVNSILEESRKTMKIHGANRLVGDVIIDGDAVFQGLQTNAIHTELFNDQSINLKNSVISKTKNQIFSNTQLRGKNISVQELEIDQLCGIPYQYWLRRSNENSANLFLKDNKIDIANDTIFLKTDLLTLNRLNLRSIDGVEINSFFSDLFIPGEKQRIKGNIIQSQTETLKIDDLIVENLNGVPQQNLMTIHTNQTLENNVFAKTMLIQNLIAKKVNGVTVSESAMVSKKNHIKGEVTIATMRILDELAIENPSKFPKVRPVQVYDQVTIFGNLKSENLALEPFTNFFSSLKNGSTIKRNNMDSILDSYWTKSSSQTIENKVFFDAGLTVDKLTVDYLNNLNISQDIMLTNSTEINEDFSSLEFMDFSTSGWVLEETEYPELATPLWTSTDETLFVNQELRIERLGAQDLNIETFNGIPIVEIMRRNSMVSGPYKYPVNSTQRFDTVTVNERLETDDLDLKYVNGQQELNLQNLLKIDTDYKIEYLKAETLALENISFLSETGKESELHKFAAHYLQKITESSELDSNEEFSLKIDNNLEVENDLKVDVINHQSTKNYLEDLASQDFSVSSDEQLIIDSLVVHNNLSFNFLHGSKIESLLQNILLKSREQNLSDSRISFYKISVDDLRSERINKRLTSDFVYTDDYDIQFGGDVTFTNLNLSLDEDTQTKSLNGYPIDTIYNQLGEIDLLAINDFTVNGNVSWESGGWSLAGSQLQLGPLDTIIKSALVKNSARPSNAPQVINGQMRINSPSSKSPGVSIRLMKYKQDYSKLANNSLKFPEGLQGVDMNRIVSDAVLDDPSNDKGIEIVSKKNFAQDLKASRLNVAGEIGIDSLNNWKVNDLNSSVVRKESLSTFIGEEINSRKLKERNSRNDNQQDNLMIFREDVSIKKLVIQPNNEFSSVPVIHGVPVTAIVLTTTIADKYLPNNTYLKHLEVRGNAFVKSLDNVNLDEFVNERVTINSNHQVQGNLQFNGRVQVSQGAKIRTINGIEPSDFVINNSHQDEIISGEKTFNGDIEVNGKTFAPSIAGINFKEEYDNGVLNYQDTDIFGDIIFKAEIDRAVEINSPTSWQLNSSGGGLVNGMRLKSFLNDRDTEEENILRGLKRNESRLELSVVRASNASSHLPEIFYYFESEDDLAITVAKVDRVEVIKIEQLTLLNLYATESPSYCGLKDGCPCRRQYVAEITANSCDSHEVEGSRIVYNFHEPHGTFGVTVSTTSVSSSKTCTTAGKNSSMEFTTISWIKTRPGNPLGEKITENALKIYGYLSDVEVFTQNDLVFIVLAIYYDPIQQSHETNSLIYVLDVLTNDLTLAQGIPTSYASGVQVFKIPSKGVHILFTSSGGGFGKSSMSMLYRLEPSTTKFELLRIFTTGGNLHAKSVSQPKDEFLFLDDSATNSINVYVYNAKWDNFYFYQSLYHNSMAPITAIETLYAGEFRRSQVYVIVTTKHDQFFVYEYTYFAKFQIIAQKKMKDILTMVPFDISNRRYMFVGTETNSTILRVIKQGRN